MFITYSEAEVPLGLLAGKSDVRHWRYAELSLPCVWFYVSIGYQRSDTFGQTTLLLTGIREFEELLSDRDAERAEFKVQGWAPNPSVERKCHSNPVASGPNPAFNTDARGRGCAPPSRAG